MQSAVRFPMLSPTPQISRACRIVAAGLCLLAVPAAAPLAQYGNARSSSFARAERLREALEGRPEQQRTRLQYERVMEAYRTIYHGDPASPKADASIAAVADLLAEEGRIFQDEKALHDAIAQYEFLRREYPASRYRYSALLTEGEIYQRDLGDREQAKAAYENFLRQYPQNALADEARIELKNIRHEETSRAVNHPPAHASGNQGSHRNQVLTAAVQSQQQEKPAHRTPQPAAPQPATPQPAAASQQPVRPQQSTNRNATQSAKLEESDIPPPPTASAKQPAPSSAVESDDDSEDDSPARVADTAAPASTQLSTPPPPPAGQKPLITGIRHWSTTVYTRVAIDLQQTVRFQAARVPNPDRIFFDLYGTRLSPELVGHSVEVTDDGFLTRIRAAQYSGDITRIVLDVNSVSDYSAFLLPNPPRLIIDVHGRRGAAPPLLQVARVTPPAAIPSNTKPESATIAAPTRPAPPAATPAAVFPDVTGPSPLADVARLSSQPNQVKATKRPTTDPVVASVAGTTPAPQPAAPAPSPSRVTRHTPAPKPAVDDDVPPAEAGAPGVPAAQAQASQHLPNSMVRALGLKINRIVIDAGHGGHDSGTLGPGGLEEKDVVLDVALRLGKLLKQRLGADVIYTRSDDTFIPLETRTAIANQAQADLFISVHANSSPDASARGVETYYLNFTTSADALEVAARENAVSDQSIHQLSDLVKKIALQDKINESREFASDVEDTLYSGLEQGNPGLKDRGVKKAPFVVLIGANMPSILAEISFLTNPDDAQELRESAYRERIAESLYRGVSRYVSSLNGVRLAQVSSRPGNSE